MRWHLNAMNNSEEIGKRLIFRRTALGWSQVCLSQKSGVSLVQVSRYELGKVKPTPVVLTKLAQALSVSFTWLAYGRDDEAPADGDMPPGRLRVSTDLSNYIITQAKIAGVEPDEMTSRLIKIGIAIYELEIKSDNKKPEPR
ncbi:helix-turn-helix domain-containing protein [Rouxiella sp. S1S-2]|nr:helix-turn-helix domain-containing protein [Rouxiella sp. S1S-2]